MVRRYDSERELLDDLFRVPTTRNWEVYDRRTGKPQPKKRARKALPPGDPRHGTVNGYNNHGCHCDDCKEAWRLYGIARKRARGVKPLEEYHAQFDNLHNANRYSKGKCRCEICTKAASARRREARARAAQRRMLRDN